MKEGSGRTIFSWLKLYQATFFFLLWLEDRQTSMQHYAY